MAAHYRLSQMWLILHPPSYFPPVSVIGPRFLFRHFYLLGKWHTSRCLSATAELLLWCSRKIEKITIGPHQTPVFELINQRWMDGKMQSRILIQQTTLIMNPTKKLTRLKKCSSMNSLKDTHTPSYSVLCLFTLCINQSISLCDLCLTTSSS